ncbi:site-specific integrase [Oceanithermus sp.]|uniref:tyrosine-type recombinase/integrase n=1 Tax=Oceanithermus sp. TaxID=2268145 RepID=UPI00257C9A16|nr:site-specific integrase [Oceanithermus sp.]
MPRRPALPPNSKLRKDGRIEVRVQVDGRRISRYARSPEDAWALYAELAVERQRGRLSRSGWTVAAWLERRLASRRGLAPTTVREDRRIAGIINQALGDLLLEDLTPMQVQDWLDGLDYSHRTKLRALQTLRNALAEAEALELVHRNAAAPVKLPRKPRQSTGQAWTLDEARRFLAAAEGRRLYPLYRLMLTLGLRVGEAIALKLDDWAHDPTVGSWRLRVERTATVEGSYTVLSSGVKTPAARRTIYAPDDLAEVLRVWLERRALEASLPSWDEQGWLIPASNGHLLSHNNVRRDLRAAIADAGVPSIRLHDLRHTAANLMRQAGVGREVRMQILGHQIRDVHDIYAHHVEPGELVRAARVLHGLFPMPGETPTGVTGVSKKEGDGA